MFPARLLCLLSLAAVAACAPGTPTAGGSPAPGASAAPSAKPSAGASSAAPAAGQAMFVVAGKPVDVTGKWVADAFKPTNFQVVWGQAGANIGEEARLLLQINVDAEVGKTGTFTTKDVYGVAALVSGKVGVHSLDWNRDQNKNNVPNPVEITVGGGKATVKFKATIPRSGVPNESLEVEASITDAPYNKKF